MRQHASRRNVSEMMTYEMQATSRNDCRRTPEDGTRHADTININDGRDADATPRRHERRPRG